MKKQLKSFAFAVLAKGRKGKFFKFCSARLALLINIIYLYTKN